MTLIQIFDRIATHLLTQKAKSSRLTDTGTPFCGYRDNHGRSCAVGCLISDEYYTESLERKAAYTKEVKWAVANSLGIPFNDVPEALLERLQGIHDNTNPEEWPVLLENLRNELPTT